MEGTQKYIVYHSPLVFDVKPLGMVTVRVAMLPSVLGTDLVSIGMIVVVPPFTFKRGMIWGVRCVLAQVKGHILGRGVLFLASGE